MLNLLPSAVPEHIPLRHAHDLALRRARSTDAPALARAVEESRAHLLPWMPWAQFEASWDVPAQAQRLADGEQAWRRGEEFNFVLVGNESAGESRVLGACGLMTRRAPRTLEIGYWVHAQVSGRGYASSLASALTEVGARIAGVDELLIVCDAANVRSAAIPRALRYFLRSVQSRPVSAPGEAGQEMLWVRAGRG